MAQLYKKTGTCSRPSGAQTDYPMYLWVGESAGSIMYRACYPPAHSDTYVKATSKYDNSYQPYYATDPSLSLIDGHTFVSWMSSGTTNQRFHFDLGASKCAIRIKYENFHSNGSFTDRGAKNFTLWGSNSATAFAELAYGTDTDWTQIGGALQFDEHTASNVADPKYITVSNTVFYRYYALKIADNWGSANNMGLRHIELQENIVYTHCSAHCQTDFGDIRFHDAADAELKYMIDWGSLQGTTPNQSVGVWVAPSPGTYDTNVVLKYGDSSLTDASTSTIFIKYDNAERGSNTDAVGGDWTVHDGTVRISTDHAYSGTRSIKFVGAATAGKAYLTGITASNNIAIQFRAWKEDTAGMSWAHGDADYNGWYMWDTNEALYYSYAGSYVSVGVPLSKDAWHKIELHDFDHTAHTHSLSVDDVLIDEDMTMTTPISWGIEDNALFVYNRVDKVGVDCYVDEVIVRKYANPEPTWGTWGEETEIEPEAVTETTSLDGLLQKSFTATTSWVRLD